MKPGVSDETVRRIEQATGRIATQSVARMDESLPWFRELPADQRSWVTLVAQAGLQSYVEWLRSPDDVLRLTGEVFASAPRAMARSVTLQQTVELVRQTIAVAEQNLPLLARREDADLVREELLRFSREIAFAAARVYASAAESRGSWDDRLEALVIDRLVSGLEVGDTLPSQLAALGWHVTGPIGVVVGSAPEGDPAEALVAVHALTRRLRLDAMAGVHGRRLVVVVRRPPTIRVRPPARLLPAFGPGPVVVGPRAAAAVRRARRSPRRRCPGCGRRRAWPRRAAAGRGRRAAAGASAARRHRCARPAGRPASTARWSRPGDVLVETLTAFLDSGGALEATARALFVHANTVRYRLRRVAEVCGETPTDARGAFVLRIALTLGRLSG